MFFHPSFLGTSLIITGGCYDDYENPAKTTYILHIVNDPTTNEVSEISYDTMEGGLQHSRGFGVVCEGRLILGGGRDNNNKRLNIVKELDLGEFLDLPSLNVARSEVGSCYLNQTLIISGGFGSSNNELDSIEQLQITAQNNGSKFIVSGSKLPYPVRGHTLSSLNGKLILIGGNDWGSILNKVWEGTPDWGKNTITWKEMPSMQKKRYLHFSCVVNNKIYVMGGVFDGEDKVEIFNGNRWITGPSVPINISRSDSQLIVTRKNTILILHSVMGIVNLDPESLKFKRFEDKKLRDKRQWFNAMLQ